MLPVQDDAGFHEGGQYVHLTEVNPLPFVPGFLHAECQGTQKPCLKIGE